MPLFWLSLAFLCGVVFGKNLSTAGLPPWSGAALAALGLVVLLVRPYLKRRIPNRFRVRTHLPLPLAALLLSFGLGAARYQVDLPRFSPAWIGWYNGSPYPYEVEGVLVEPPDERDRYANLKVEVDHLRLEGEPEFQTASGKLLARVRPGGGWRYGDRVQLRGLLETPPEDETFSYRDYLAIHGVYTWMPEAEARLLESGQGSPFYTAMYWLRDRLLRTVYRLYPDPEASLLAGIVLGVETGIPEKVAQAFQATGTSHIIAISGFNLTLVAGLFAGSFTKALGKRRGALAALLGIGLYTVLVGAAPGVVRAAIMGGMAIFARQIGRRQSGLNSLAFVAAVMAAFDPKVPWDIGFQLSFMATLGLVLFAEPLTRTFVALTSLHLPATLVNKLAGPVGEYLLFTLAAQLTTLPVILYHFGRLSLASVLANPLILPAQPAVMVMGGLGTILGALFLPLGRLVSAIAWPFTAYTIRVVEALAQLPGAEVDLGKSRLEWIVLFYTLLFAWTFRGKLGRIGWFGRLAGAVRRRVTPRPAMGILALGALAVFSWRAALGGTDGRLHVIVLDVGSGDAVLVETPSGRRLLVDGGPSATRLSDGLGRRAPLGRAGFDWWLVGGPGAEQIGALPQVVERFPPDNVLWSGMAAGSYEARLLQAALVNARVPVTTAQAGQRLDLGQGALLRVLAAGPRGMLLLVEWGSFRFLLPAGLDLGALEEAEAIGPVSGLLLADSGYLPSNPPEWIARLQPAVTVISVGAGDVRGAPDPEVLQALEGYSMLRTDRNGWVEITTDGESMWVEVERP